MALTTAERTNIIKLVVAMFNAAPGATYLGELTVAYEANGRSLSNLAKDLSQTTAYKALNPVFQTASEFATALLTPLGLQANTIAIDFVTAKFNAGLSKGQIAYDVAAALEATTDAAFADAKAILNNKTNVAEYYSVTKAIAQTNVGTLQQSISTVTKDAASITTAKTSIDNGTSGTSGNTITLTTSVDSLVGTTNNDSFAGVISATTGESSLTLADSIDGGSGTDSLTVTVSGNVALPAASITNVEKIYIKNLAGAATAHDFSGVSGITEAWASAGSVDTAFTGLGNVGIGIQNTTKDLTVTFKDSAFTNGGTLALKLENAGSATTTPTLTVGPATTLGTASAISIEAVGANYLKLAGAANYITSNGSTKTLTVTGTGTLKLDATSTLTATAGDIRDSLTKLDASANTGGVTASVGKATVAVTGGAGKDKITITGAATAGASFNLGAGDDQLLVNGGSVDANVVVDAGEGNDVVSNGLITVANGGIFKNFEQLALDAAVTTDIELLTGSKITSLLINGNVSATAQNVATASTVDVTSTTAAGATTIAVKGAAAALTDSLTFNFNGSAQAATPVAANIKAGTVVANSVETLNLVSGGATNTWNSIAITDSKLQTVVITGSKNIDVTFAGVNGTVAVDNTGGVASIDASALTGKLAINLANVTKAVAGLSVKGGTAADTFTTAAFSSSLTGGAGTDKYVVTASVAGTNDATTAVITTIADFAVGDSIALGTLTGLTKTQTDIAAATNLTNALDLAVKNAGVTQDKAAWFQYGGNTYVVVEDANDGFGANTTNDVVIKLTGLIDLTNASVAGNALTLV